jgi:hypothetical protein
MPASGSTISDSPVGTAVLVEVAGCVLVGLLGDVVVPLVRVALVELELLSFAGEVQPAAHSAAQRISPIPPSFRDRFTMQSDQGSC